MHELKSSYHHLSASELREIREGIKTILINALLREAFILSNENVHSLTRWTYEFKSVVEQIGVLLGQEVFGHSKPERGLDLGWWDPDGLLTLALESEWGNPSNISELIFDFQKIVDAVSKAENALGIMIFDGGVKFSTVSNTFGVLEREYKAQGCRKEVLLLAIEGGWQWKIRARTIGAYRDPDGSR